MEQAVMEVAEVEAAVDHTSIQELTLAQLALIGGGEVCVTFD